MARKVTLQTKLQCGQIVRVRGRVIGIVVRHEKFLDRPGFYAFNNSPGDRKFIRENGVDWYKRYHREELVRQGAEVITWDELLSMYGQTPSNELKTLVKMTRRRKRSR